MSASTTLREYQDHRAVSHDPVLRWALCLDCPFSRSAVRVAGLTLVIPLLLVSVALVHDHNFRLHSGAIGLSQDWNILSMFVVFPAALLILRVIVRRFGKFLRAIPGQTYNRASIELALVTANERIDGMLAGKGKWAAAKLAPYIAALAYVVYNAYNRCYQLDLFYFSHFWTSCNYPTTYWLTNLYTSLVWGYLIPAMSFVVFVILVAVCRIAVVLRKEAALRIELLSSDGMGGLRPIANLALSLSYIIIPFQAQLAVYFLWIPGRHPPFYIGLFFVVCLSVVLFFTPILYVHRAMKRSKIAALEELGKEARNNYALLRDCWRDDHDLEREALLFQRIKQIRELYDLVDATHVWPFDVRVVSRFFSSIVIPILPVALKGLYDSQY